MRYHGYYITKKNGIRVGISFSYAFDDKGKMCDEQEDKVTVIKA